MSLMFLHPDVVPLYYKINAGIFVKISANEEVLTVITYIVFAVSIDTLSSLQDVQGGAELNGET